MKKSPLVSILRSFSKKEVREMRKWLHSPIHNQREDVIRLFDFFIEDNHLNKDDFLEKPTIFSWIFPKETYDDAKMRQVIFFLSKTIEEFLIYQEVFDDKISTQLFLARTYGRRKLDKSFKKTINNFQKLQKENLTKNEKFYRNDYLIQIEEFEYLNKANKPTTNLQEISNSLDITFLIGKLRQSCLILSHQAKYKKDYDIKLLDNVLELVERDGYLDIPIIATYYFIYKTLVEKENETHFQNLKEQIKENSHVFSLIEIRDIYLMAINYCIRRINVGSTSFIREAFELYKSGFEKKVLIENNLISQVTYNNAISSGLRLMEFEWVENFIQEYQKYLVEKHREGYTYYNLARLHFEKNDYEKARELLIQEVQYDDIIIGLTAKILLSKIYYEESELDALESLLESIRTYLQRKKVMGYHKSNFKNIIRYFKKLIRTNPYNNGQKEKLKIEIEAANPLTEKEWLLEQLEKL